jgi:hypothetical protein
MVPMPHFLLTFGHAGQRPVGVVIIEAPSMLQAHVSAVARRLAPGVPFGECHELSANMMTSIPPTLIDRVMSSTEAEQLFVEGGGAPEAGRR